MPPGGLIERDLFISHSSADAVAARELRAELEAAGYTTWMAPDDVGGTDPWAEQILGAIRNSRAMLVLVSARANASPHVSREVGLANGRNRAILPVRIEDVDPEGALAYHLEGLQRVDVFPPPVAAHRDRLLRRLERIVPIRSEPVSPSADESEATQVVSGAALAAAAAATAASAGTAAAAPVATAPATLTEAGAGGRPPTARVPSAAVGPPSWRRGRWAAPASLLALAALVLVGTGILVLRLADGGGSVLPTGTLAVAAGSLLLSAPPSTGPITSPSDNPTTLPTFSTIPPLVTAPQPSPTRTPRPPTPKPTKAPTAPPPPTPTPPPATNPAKITSHANGAILHGTSVTFSWTTATGATAVKYYGLYVGSTPPSDPCSPGAYCKEPGDDAFASSDIEALSLGPSVHSGQVNGLPADGSTIYVRIFTKYEPESGILSWRDYTFTSAP